MHGQQKKKKSLVNFASQEGHLSIGLVSLGKLGQEQRLSLLYSLQAGNWVYSIFYLMCTGIKRPGHEVDPSPTLIAALRPLICTSIPSHILVAFASLSTGIT
jgi:hypothetical protein